MTRAAAVIGGVALLWSMGSTSSALPGPVGRLTQLAGTAGCLTSDAQRGCARLRGFDAGGRVAVTADGRSVYITGLASLVVLSRNVANGELAQLPALAGCVQSQEPGWVAHRRCLKVHGLWPTDVVVAPDGRNVYVTSAVDDRAHGGPFSSLVEILDRNRLTGTVRENRESCLGRAQGRRCTAVRGLDAPASVLISPDGRFVYVGSWGGIVVFRRLADGSLRQLAGAAGCVLARALSSCSARPKQVAGVDRLAMNPDGSTVYAVAALRWTGGAYAPALVGFSRNARSGVLTRIAASGGCFTTEPLEGCASAAWPDGDAWDFTMTVSPDGKNLYVASGAGIAVFARGMDGRLSPLPGRNGCLDSEGWHSECARYTGNNVAEPTIDVAVSPDGVNLYLVATSGILAEPASLVTFVRDKTTGSLTFVGCAATDTTGCTRVRALGEPTGVVVTRDGRNVYATGLHGTISPEPGQVVAFQRRG